jgi:hypothetical protein
LISESPSLHCNGVKLRGRRSLRPTSKNRVPGAR